MKTTFELSAGFLPKGGLERGQLQTAGNLQNNCPLLVWQNQGNFMRSLIETIKDISREVTGLHQLTVERNLIQLQQNCLVI